MIIKYNINPFNFTEYMTVADIQQYIEILNNKEEEKQKMLDEARKQNRSGGMTSIG